jgi:NADH dehydrogenase
VHHLFPQRLARLCAAAGVKRLVHLSAIGASADSPSVYARSKAAGEQAVRQHFPKSSILRPSIVFGADDNFFNQFARLSLASPFLPLIGGGSTRFQPVYVGDVSAAIMACVERSDTQGQTCELGGASVYTFRQLMKKVGEYTGRRRCLPSVPWGIAGFMAFFTGLLPVPPLTRDQIKLLGIDNVVSPAARTLANLHITPTALEAVVPEYLQAYRRGGRWAAPAI